MMCVGVPGPEAAAGAALLLGERARTRLAGPDATQ